MKTYRKFCTHFLYLIIYSMHNFNKFHADKFMAKLFQFSSIISSDYRARSSKEFLVKTFHSASEITIYYLLLLPTHNYALGIHILVHVNCLWCCIQVSNQKASKVLPLCSRLVGRVSENLGSWEIPQLRVVTIIRVVYLKQRNQFRFSLCFNILSWLHFYFRC